MDRLAPIDAVPLDRGRLRVTVRESLLNGSGERAIDAASKSVLARHAEKGSPASVPLDLVIETTEARILMQSKSTPAVRLEPALIRELTTTLGESSVRLVGGVTIEAEEKPRWKSRQRDEAEV